MKHSTSRLDYDLDSDMTDVSRSMPAPGKLSTTTRIARAASSPGAALPGDLRSRFESSLGADLSGVRVHTDATSGDAASAIGARAYATGDDIHFASGQYDPSSAFGVHLIAHEVAHTVQQRRGGGALQPKLEISSGTDAAELEADRAADAMVAGAAFRVAETAAPIARKEEYPTSKVPKPKNSSSNQDALDFGMSTKPNRPPMTPVPKSQQQPKPKAPWNDASAFKIPMPPPKHYGTPTDEITPHEPAEEEKAWTDPQVDPYDPGNETTRGVPAPIDWTALPGIAGSPGEGAWGGDPEFWADYAGYTTYQGAFTARWNDAQESYNRYHAVHAVLSAGGRDILARVGMDAGVSAKTAGVDATKSFTGGDLRDDLQVDPTKATPDDRRLILEKKELVASRRTAVIDKTAAIATATANFDIAGNGVYDAVDAITIVTLEQEIENQNLDGNQVKRDLENFKAKTKTAVEMMKTFGSLINALNPTAVVAAVAGTVTQGFVAAGAAAEEGATLAANKALKEIDDKIRDVTNQKFALQHATALRAYHTALGTLANARRALEEAVRAVENAQNDYARAYRELGGFVAKVGASGMKPKQRAALAGAIEAMPRIEQIIGIIRGMRDGFPLPTYDADAGVGLAMAVNGGEFLSHVALLKGNQQYLTEQLTVWEARKASVDAVIEASTSVEDTDWP